MAQLIWTQDELLAEHDYERPHQEMGVSFHGGFDEKGCYISPRTKNRWRAVKSWQKQLDEKGWEILDASQALLKRGNYPNEKQQVYLLNHNLGQGFWDGLTITGVIEARGAMLVNYQPPDLQKIIIEDISQTATGHLAKGLLLAHGLDEGGDPNQKDKSKSKGAHDQMWFMVRDLIFGENAYPLPATPPSIERPKEKSFFAQLDDGYDFLFTLLTDVLMVEVRAEAYFNFCVNVISNPEAFGQRRVEADLAVEMVERIRIDEAIHVAYLQTVLSELRQFTFLGKNGHIQGHLMFDPIWRDMVEWHGQTQFDIVRQTYQDKLYQTIKEQNNKDSDQLIAQFESYGDRDILAAE